LSQNQANPSLLVLGGKNTLFVDEILVGGKKQPGTMLSTQRLYDTVSFHARQRWRESGASHSH